MFRRLGHFTYRHRRALLVIGALLLLLGGLATPGLFPVLSNGGYDNPSAESAEVGRILQQRFGGGQDALVVLMTSRDGALVDSPAFSTEAREVLARVAKHPGVSQVRDYYGLGAAQLVASDKRSTFAVVLPSLVGRPRAVGCAGNAATAGCPPPPIHPAGPGRASDRGGGMRGWSRRLVVFRSVAAAGRRRR